MKTWPLVAVVGCIVVSAGAGIVIGRQRAAPLAVAAASTTTPAGASFASVVHDVVTHGSSRVDLYVPKSDPAGARAPWMLFAHERGWPAPDDKERTGAAIADALQRRGIGVAVVSFDVSEAHPLARAAEEVADVVRDLTRRSSEYGLRPEPVLAGDELGAALVTSLALDPRYEIDPAKLRGVVAMNGVYADDDLARLTTALRPGAPRMLVLSAHGESPSSAQSSRKLLRALEQAGAKDAHGYFVSARDQHSLTNLSGDHNDVGDVVAAFVGGEPSPGGPETTWALADTWGKHAPLSSEPFWADEKLVVRRPTDARFRAAVRNVFGEMARDLEPWPAQTYDAIDLGDYLRAHPELGSGDFLAVTNARGEQMVLTRSEIARQKPVIVIGIDDERNLFRMFVTYEVRRTYSWKPETTPRPLLVRNVGAFLYVPSAAADAGAVAVADGGLHVITLADFALTTSSFALVAQDPIAVARTVPKPFAAALTNEQGCLQCHTFHGEGARAHHLRADTGQVAEGFGLALEEYPRDVMQRFLFEQDAVSKAFGVNPLRVDKTAATQLFAALAK